MKMAARKPGSITDIIDVRSSKTSLAPAGVQQSYSSRWRSSRRSWSQQVALRHEGPRMAQQRHAGIAE